MDRDSSTAREPYERVTVENLRKEVARRKLKLIKRGPDSNNTKECLVQLLRDNDRGIDQQVVGWRQRPNDEVGRSPVPRIAAAVSVSTDQFRPVPPAPILLPIPVFSNAPSPMIRPRTHGGGSPGAATSDDLRTAPDGGQSHTALEHESDEEQLDHAIKSLDMISRALVSVNSVIANLRDELVHTTERSDEHECMVATLGHFKRVRMEFLKETQHFTWVSTHAMTSPQAQSRPPINNAQPPTSMPRTSSS
ncbi:hypothetical protein SPRG_03309 [Saprolegnia parasitica CBS 223.65]|uniref:Uncharacterized protein n=1 Tax=Saprolegnia parasitica (strain CBS 223.65) TaxID=695850 RepID=A0A067CN14_SAPPC|nr:hypothetical protein SPRG_03309 [Saprolegnia parasitica CBS 223.65]KDO32089.1 hypothetical protein SPRG_03309 [Saprolegnia parasitica CBS 223.65]|eukprot:XP_012197276.1 hypothetical protein SPRG_03309 [Saprolegnia parasitica CBS 223.65]